MSQDDPMPPPWMVHKTRYGVVDQVLALKPTGRQYGWWVFEKSIDNSGRPVLHVERRDIPSMGNEFDPPLSSWVVEADRADGPLENAISRLVGTRTARGVVSRFNNGGANSHILTS